MFFWLSNFIISTNFRLFIFRFSTNHLEHFFNYLSKMLHLLNLAQTPLRLYQIPIILFMCDSNQPFPIPLPGKGGDINSQLCPRPMGYHFRPDPHSRSYLRPAPPRLARPDPFITFALPWGLSLEKVARSPGTFL